MSKTIRIVATLSLAALTGFILLLGGAGQTYADDDVYLDVSATNPYMDNIFGGAQIIEVTLNHDTYRADSAYDNVREPLVTVNGKQLRMMQAGNGYWYGYFVEFDAATAAHENGIDFGTLWGDSSFNYDADALYVNDDMTRNVLDDPWLPKKSIVIQAFDFYVGERIVVKSPGAESVAVTYGNTNTVAKLLASDVSLALNSLMKIGVVDPWLNIDPTEVDEWIITGDGQYFYRVTDDQFIDMVDFEAPIQPVDRTAIGCSQCAFSVNTGNQGDAVIFHIGSNTGFYETAILGPMAITYTETLDNSAIFSSGYIIQATDDDELVGNTATVTYGSMSFDVTVSETFSTTSNTWDLLNALNAEGREFTYMQLINNKGIASITLGTEPVLHVETTFPPEYVQNGDLVAFAPISDEFEFSAKRVHDTWANGYLTLRGDYGATYGPNVIMPYGDYIGRVDSYVRCVVLENNPWMEFPLIYESGNFAFLDDGDVSVWPGRFTMTSYGVCDMSSLSLEQEIRFLHSQSTLTSGE